MKSRFPLWITLLPLVAGVAIWLWLWRGYADDFKQQLQPYLAGGNTIEMQGFPYRLEAHLAPAAINHSGQALQASLTAAEAMIDRVPWQGDRQVITLIQPKLALSLKPLPAADLRITAPSAQASLRTAGSDIARLSTVWQSPKILSALFTAPVSADHLEAHLRETPNIGATTPTPAGPVQDEIELSGEGVRIGAGAPLTLAASLRTTADAPIKSYAGWASGGTLEIATLTLADATGEIARAQATVVPDGTGALRIAGTIETACPHTLRAALANQPPVTEQRLRRPAKFAFTGTLPGNLTPEPADPTQNLGPVRAQLPACPRVR